jgi:hypothetical protein
MSNVAQVTHAEAAELAGLYVLDALEAAERESVRRHLADCPMPHPEFAEVGSVVPALGQLIEPLDAPPELRQRVLSAIADDAAADAARTGTPAPAATPVWELDPGPTGRRATSAGQAVRQPSWLGWAAAAAVLVIAVLGAWSVLLQARTSELEQRSALIADAIAASTAQGSAVATLRGTGSAAGASGFAAFTAEGEGYIVLVGLPPAPAGQTYQAWYLVDGQPFSAGIASVGPDGYALLSGVERMPGTELIAFTIEQAGGVDQPTTDPIVTGELSA